MLAAGGQSNSSRKSVHGSKSMVAIIAFAGYEPVNVAGFADSTSRDIVTNVSQERFKLNTEVQLRILDRQFRSGSGERPPSYEHLLVL